MFQTLGDMRLQGKNWAGVWTPAVFPSREQPTVINFIISASALEPLSQTNLTATEMLAIYREAADEWNTAYPSLIQCNVYAIDDPQKPTTGNLYTIQTESPYSENGMGLFIYGILGERILKKLLFMKWGIV